MSASRTRSLREPEPAGALLGRLGSFVEVATGLTQPMLLTDERGNGVWANPSFEALRGVSVAELAGGAPHELLHGPDTDPALVTRLVGALRSGRPFDETLLCASRAGRQYWARTELRSVRDEAGALEGHVVVQTDVTERIVAQAREATMSRVAEGLVPCTTIEQAARVVADALASTSDVRASQVWVVEPGREQLRYLCGAAADDGAREWISIGAALSFARGTEWIVGVGAPGVAWGTQQPCMKTDFWVPDGTGHFSRRAQAAQRARIRTVCAVPVLGPEGVLAVIEIGGSHNFPGHERLPSLVERVAQQFASFLLRHQSALAFEAVFRRSPDALLLLDEQGQVSRCNARALELFGPVQGLFAGALLDDLEPLLSSAALPEDAVAIFERRGRRVDGGEFFAEVTAASATASGSRLTIVAVRDLTERRRAEEALRRSLAEKVTLIQEVHHRVKNNLQVLTGLLTLQASRSDDAPVRSALDEATHRIRSMALVHQLLYDGSDLAQIALRDYLVRLTDTLRASFAPDAEIRVEGGSVALPLEQAIPCGLLVNELLTNAFKHGRSADGKCRIEARIEPTDKGFALVVRDQGPGFVPSAPGGGSMGQTLITALVRQLRGRMTTSVNGGTEVRVEIDARPAARADATPAHPT
jgi:PAS domain S-box-containing protein